MRDGTPREGTPDIARQVKVKRKLNSNQRSIVLLVELLASRLDVPHVQLLEALQLERLCARVELLRVHEPQLVELAEPEVEQLPVARVRHVDRRAHLLDVLEVLLPPRLRNLLNACVKDGSVVFYVLKRFT